MVDELERWRTDRLLWERQKDMAEARMAEQILYLRRDVDAIPAGMRELSKAVVEAARSSAEVSAKVERVVDRLDDREERMNTAISAVHDLRTDRAEQKGFNSGQKASWATLGAVLSLLFCGIGVVWAISSGLLHLAH